MGEQFAVSKRNRGCVEMFLTCHGLTSVTYCCQKIGPLARMCDQRVIDSICSRSFYTTVTTLKYRESMLGARSSDSSISYRYPSRLTKTKMAWPKPPLLGKWVIGGVTCSGAPTCKSCRKKRRSACSSLPHSLFTGAGTKGHFRSRG
jgi:hypothetical protein